MRRWKIDEMKTQFNDDSLQQKFQNVVRRKVDDASSSSSSSVLNNSVESRTMPVNMVGCRSIITGEIVTVIQMMHIDIAVNVVLIHMSANTL